MTDVEALVRGRGFSPKAPDPEEPSPFQKWCKKWWHVVAVIAAVAIAVVFHKMGAS